MAAPGDGVPAMVEEPVQPARQDKGKLTNQVVLENPVPRARRLTGNYLTTGTA